MNDRHHNDLHQAASRRRSWMLVVIITLVAAAFGLYRVIGSDNDVRNSQSTFRMPVSDPPPDPNRPDLFGEP